MNDVHPVVLLLRTEIERQQSEIAKQRAKWLTVPMNISPLIGLYRQFEAIQKHLRRYPPAQVNVHGSEQLADSFLDLVAEELIQMHVNENQEIRS